MDSKTFNKISIILNEPPIFPVRPKSSLCRVNEEAHRTLYRAVFGDVFEFPESIPRLPETPSDLEESLNLKIAEFLSSIRSPEHENDMNVEEIHRLERRLYSIRDLIMKATYSDANLPYEPS